MKIIIISIVCLFAFPVAYSIWHNHKYKCINGHYEMTRHAAPAIHYTKDWYCDEYILRSEYNKNPNNYPQVDCGCN